MSTNGHVDIEREARRNGYPDPAQNDHTCPGCGAPVACEWKTIAMTRRRAASLVMQARQMEATLAGEPMGKKRTRSFTDDEARALYAVLGTFTAVAKKLGVNRQTVTRVLAPEKLPESVKRRKGVAL